MNDLFFLEGLEYEDPGQMSASALAFVGDAVYDLFIRGKLVAEGIRNSGKLHTGAVGFVKAAEQRAAFERVAPLLNEQEKRIAGRGRNTGSGSVPKSADPSDYRAATAFEALLGYLYLKKDTLRLSEILKAAAGADK